uniref:VP7 n=1 Tax=Zoersel tick virus TaxID=2867438 RepID=A0A8G0QGF4_9REOV|nr:VP7 [Zoersel tick virus]
MPRRNVVKNPQKMSLLINQYNMVCQYFQSHYAVLSPYELDEQEKLLPPPNDLSVRRITYFDVLGDPIIVNNLRQELEDEVITEEMLLYDLNIDRTNLETFYTTFLRGMHLSLLKVGYNVQIGALTYQPGIELMSLAPRASTISTDTSVETSHESRTQDSVLNQEDVEVNLDNVDAISDDINAFELDIELIGIDGLTSDSRMPLVLLQGLNVLRPDGIGMNEEEFLTECVQLDNGFEFRHISVVPPRRNQIINNTISRFDDVRGQLCTKLFIGLQEAISIDRMLPSAIAYWKSLVTRRYFIAKDSRVFSRTYKDGRDDVINYTSETRAAMYFNGLLAVAVDCMLSNVISSRVINHFYDVIINFIFSGHSDFSLKIEYYVMIGGERYDIALEEILRSFWEVDWLCVLWNVMTDKASEREITLFKIWCITTLTRSGSAFKRPDVATVPPYGPIQYRAFKGFTPGKTIKLKELSREMKRVTCNPSSLEIKSNGQYSYIYPSTKGITLPEMICFQDDRHVKILLYFTAAIISKTYTEIEINDIMSKNCLSG